MTMSDQSPILHPEYGALAEENALLREELAHLLTTEHDLIHTEKHNLLALYQKKIGAWELRALQAQVAASRARRKLEMAQAAINQGRSPDWNEIEGLLELEFLLWQQKIAEAAENLAAAKDRLEHLLPAEKDREIKKLYYGLVKMLHPDLHPELRDEPRRLWMQTQTAYQAGDLDGLRALALVVEKSPPASAAPPTLDALREQIRSLQKQIENLEKRIAHIESQPPFTLRRHLYDDEWVAARREEIEARIKQLDAQHASLNKCLQALFSPDDNDGKLFGSN